ncbi:Intraflagellar transport protein 122 homolog, partial [Geodia barretti]
MPPVWPGTQTARICCATVENNMLSIKASTFPIHQQKQAGFVVGFMASKIFCLHFSTMKTIDVPQSAPMVQYVERKLYKDAYRIACLGVTEEDWRLLALEAFEGLDLEVAKKSFLRLRDLKYLELIHSIEERRKRGENINSVFLADFYAYQSKFEEAAQLYRKAGQDQKAVEMFTDLREFEKAKQYLTPGRGRGKDRGGGVVANESRELLSKQAEWARNSNDPQAACDMYLTVGDHHKALEIMIENGWTDRMVNLAHDVDISQEPLLRLCARHLKSSGHYAQAAEVFEKLGDHKSLVSLYVDSFQWENAFDLVRKHPQYRGDVYFPYAAWLIENDRFDEAQEALTRAGREDEALHLLEELAENAIHETRFEDAGHYYWLLAKSCLNHAKRDRLDPSGSSVEVEKHVSKFRHFLSLSESYHVYSTVHQFIDQPFTNTLPDVFLNCANYLLHKLSDPYPRGISKLYPHITKSLLFGFRILHVPFWCFEPSLYP